MLRLDDIQEVIMNLQIVKSEEKAGKQRILIELELDEPGVTSNLQFDPPLPNEKSNVHYMALMLAESLDHWLSGLQKPRSMMENIRRWTASISSS